METPAERYRFADFTEAAYSELITTARATYSFEPLGTSAEGAHVIWRHDVDFSVHRALALARIEREAGVRSTYLVRTRSAFYNLLEPQVQLRVREIAALGHWIGLHFDMSAYPGVRDGRELESALAFERDIVAEASGAEVGAFSFHNPGHSGGATIGAERLAGMVNAYGRGLFERYAYVSDSNGYWRDRPLADVLADAPERLHVLTHPEWWQEVPMSPRQRMLRCIEGLAEYAAASYEDPVRDAGRKIVD